MLFIAYPVEATGCGAAALFIQNIAEKREHQCGEDVVYIKTETKPFTQNTYLSHFLEGHLSPLHSRLAKESRMFRKHVKLMNYLYMVYKHSFKHCALFSKIVMLFYCFE